jgi:hypothetical protein
VVSQAGGNSGNQGLLTIRFFDRNLVPKREGRMGLNARIVKKGHLRKIKTKSGVKTIRVKAATAGSVQNNKKKK